MRTLTLHRASPVISNEPVEELTIVVSPDIDEMREKADDLPPGAQINGLEAVFAYQAAALAEALHNSLPGGTYSRLVNELNRRNVSDYCGRAGSL